MVDFVQKVSTSANKEEVTAEENNLLRHLQKRLRRRHVDEVVELKGNLRVESSLVSVKEGKTACG